MIIEAHSIRSREKERCVSTAPLALSDFEKNMTQGVIAKRLGVSLSWLPGSLVRASVVVFLGGASLPFMFFNEINFK